jgi:hypothetical protein
MSGFSAWTGKTDISLGDNTRTSYWRDWTRAGPFADRAHPAILVAKP